MPDNKPALYKVLEQLEKAEGPVQGGDIVHTLEGELTHSQIYGALKRLHKEKRITYTGKRGNRTYRMMENGANGQATQEPLKTRKRKVQTQQRPTLKANQGLIDEFVGIVRELAITEQLVETLKKKQEELLRQIKRE